MRRPCLIATITIIILISFLGCSDKSQEPSTASNLTIAIKSDPQKLHPIVYPSSSSREVYQYIFLPLADYDPKSYDLSPILIEQIPEAVPVKDGPYKGGVSYTVKIKDEAKWDNGQSITAEDYLFTIKSILHPLTDANNYRTYISSIDHIAIDSKDSKQFTVFFKKDYMLSKETVLTMEIYPKYIYDPNQIMDDITLIDLKNKERLKSLEQDSLFRKFAEQFNSNLFTRDQVVGAGPYKLEEWITDQKIVLKKKENYWAKDSSTPSLMAGPDQITFYIIADDAAAITQIKEGNIDVYKYASTESFFELKNHAVYGNQFQFFTPSLMKYYYIALNNQSPELQDKDVRRALAHLVDVQQLISVLEQGLGVPTVGLFNQKKPYYAKNLDPIPYDPAMAKRILANEGWEDTNNNGTIDKQLKNQLVEFELDLFITGSNLSSNIAILLQEAARSVGIKINIISKKYSEIRSQHIKTRDYDLVPLVATQDLAPDDPYAKWHSDNDMPAGNNDISYRSPKADQLMDSIRSTKDEAKRNEMYLDLQEVIYEDQPVIFLYSPTEKIIVSNRWDAYASTKRPGYFANTFKISTATDN